MNKDNAHLYLPLVQALADGKTIEHNFGGVWGELNEFEFDSPPQSYRIKPEPVVVTGKITETTYWPAELRGEVILEYYGDDIPSIVAKKATITIEP